MILLWGIPGDGPIASVYDSLLNKHAAVIFLDQLQIMDNQIELFVDKQVSGVLRTGTKAVNLVSITSAYIRPYDSLCLRANEDTDVKKDFSVYDMLTFDDKMLCWAELTEALVINRPSAMGSNNSKCYQADLIRSQGIDVPETLITTDEQAVLEFWEKHDKIVYKSLSGFRSIVSKLKPEQQHRLKNVSTCPTQFQEYIEGTDYRVHVVGDDIFTCKISSDADDYRYAWKQGYGVEVRSWTLPEDMSERCRKLARFLHLNVAGIDLRCTSEGKWYCFEVNPSPGFTFYQESTGQLISDSIAKLLIKSS